MKQLILFIYMSGLLFASPVGAATIEEVLAYCRAKDQEADRLACYDELARAVAEGVALPALPNSGIGKWEVSQEVSPVDDSRTVYMYLAAENEVDVRGWGLGATRPRLIVRCQEGETEVYIIYDSSLDLLEDYITVLTRFDKHAAQEHRWGLSTDKEAIFAPEGVLWARTIANAQKLFVRFTPSGESPVSATFHLMGSEEAMRPLREACGWGIDLPLDDVTIEDTELDFGLDDLAPPPPLEEEVVEEIELEEEEIVELWRVEKQPVITKKIKPKYPANAQKANITGKVFVTALVGKDGKVEQVGKITGPKVFHEVAKAAALESEFTPAMQNDRPVKVWVSLPFTFRNN